MRTLTATRLLPIPSRLSLEADIVDSIEVVDVELLFELLPSFDLNPDKIPPATLPTVGDFLMADTTGFLCKIGGVVPFDFSSRFSILFRNSVGLLSNGFRAGLSIGTAETVAEPPVAAGPVVTSRFLVSSDLR